MFEKGWRDCLPPPAHEERTLSERFINRAIWVVFWVILGFTLGYTLAFHHYVQ